MEEIRALTPFYRVKDPHIYTNISAESAINVARNHHVRNDMWRCNGTPYTKGELIIYCKQLIKERLVSNSDSPGISRSL